MNGLFADVLSIPSNPEDLFVLTECLGHGAYGHVYKGIFKATNMVVAIKIINFSKQQDYESLQREISLMKLCEECPYIVKYYGSYCSRSKNQIWIICEYCDSGSTIDLLCATDRTYTECEIATIIDMTLKALVYLHSHNLIHRDVKGANIMLNSEGYAKLGDFGVGVQLLKNESMRSSKKGSPYWMSPQVVTNSEYDSKTDIWSLGITCIELCEGEPPMSDIKPLMVMKLVAESPAKGLPDNNNYSKDFNDFVNKCLTVDPYQRPSAQELLKHSFIKHYAKPRDYIKNLVKYHLPSIYEYRKELNQIDTNLTIAKPLNSNIPETKTKPTPILKSNTNNEEMQSYNGTNKQASFSSVVINEENQKKNSPDQRTSIRIQHEDNNLLIKENKPEFLQYINNDNFIFDEKVYLEIQNKKNDKLIKQFLRKSSSQKSKPLNAKKSSNNDINYDYNNNQTLSYLSTNTNQNANYSFFRKYRNDKLLIGNMRNEQKTNDRSLKANCVITDSKGKSTLQVIETNDSSSLKLSLDVLMNDKAIANESIDTLREKLMRINTNKQYEMDYIQAKTERQITKVSLAIEVLSHFPNIKTIKEYSELYGNNKVFSTDFKTAHIKLMSLSIIDEDDNDQINNNNKSSNMNDKHKQYFI